MFEHLRDVYRGNPNRPDRPGVPGLAEYAASQGWQARPDDPSNHMPVDSSVRDHIHDIVVRRSGINNTSLGAGPTRFHDAYAGAVSGRQFVVGNAWTGVGFMSVVSVCALQLTGRALLPMMRIEPRHHGLLGIFDSQSRAVPVSPAFDERYAVYAHPAEAAEGMLTPRVQQIVLSRSDWRFWTLGTGLICMADIVFMSPADVAGFLAQMTAIADGMPTDVLPTADELIPGLPAGLSLTNVAFTGGAELDQDAMMAQFEALPPEQQAQAIQAFQQQAARLRADAEARREARKHHR
ncbi:MAG TPA: hypothetical protein VGJ28_11255 [Micromonosporaceae bacterium]